MIAQYRTLVAIPYVSALLENIKSRFTDKAVKIIIVMSIFNPTLLPTEDSLPSYGNEQFKILANFYGKEAEVQYAGIPTPYLHYLMAMNSFQNGRYLDVLC